MITLIIMLRQLEHGLLGGEVPDDDIWVIAPLPRSDHSAIITHSETGDLVIVLPEEVLPAVVLKVADHHAAARDVHEVLSVRVEEHRLVDLRWVTDRVVQFEDWVGLHSDGFENYLCDYKILL